MKFFDVTNPIYTGMPKHATDPDVEIIEFKALKLGNSCNLSKLSLGTHSGTHVDAPRHVSDQSDGLESFETKDFFGRVLVTNKEEFFDKNFESTHGVLFKDEIGLTIKQASKLINMNYRIVGIAGQSIENSEDKSHPVHRVLLENKILIIESLNLEQVPDGYYNLICLPLKVQNGDGAPARAILTYD